MANLEKIYEANNVCEISVSYKTTNNVSDLVSIRSSVDTRDFIYPFFDGFVEHHEEMWIILLNQAGKCLGVSKISQGGISQTVADIRIIMQIALKTNSTNIILCHNHPSGNVLSSKDDDNMTKRVKEACNLMDITLFDHLIVTSRLFYSYADEGRL